MEPYKGHLLSLITFFPLIGVPLLLAVPRDRKTWIRWIALATTLVPVAASFQLLAQYDPALAGVNDAASFQFVEHFAWIPSFRIDYYMGIDGLSVSMLVLTAWICPICILASWNIDKGEKGYFSLFLLLETGMAGVFCALDMILFYVFWEVMLLPMYFLIGVWGGPRRVYAAIKFFLYTLFGSLLMLLAILALYYYSEPHTFNLVTLIHDHARTFERVPAIPFLFGWTIPFAKVIFLFFFIGFAIKIPMFPFHTWLPDAHVEAPTAISVILAGVLLKMGTYGIFRVNYPLLPETSLWYNANVIVYFAVINIVYGALAAMAQKDLKKLVAYSSVSHMGFVMLGMAAVTTQGMNGALMQMFNHGTITAQLFLLVGVVYDRAHHRDIEKFGGLANVVPLYTAFTAFAFFAALGLPGLSSFVSEVLCLLGALARFPGATVLAATGVILGAGYLLWTMQRMFLGPLNEKYAKLADINGREIVSLLPLCAIVLFLGVYPRPLLALTAASVDRLIAILTPVQSLAGIVP